MYLAIVCAGALHGLVFLPVLLSLVGPPPSNPNDAWCTTFLAVSQRRKAARGDEDGEGEGGSSAIYHKIGAGNGSGSGSGAEGYPSRPGYAERDY